MQLKMTQRSGRHWFLQLRMTAICLFLLTAMLPGIRAYGADLTWTGAVGTDWNTAGNWSPAAVPTATDKVTIPSATNAPVVSATATVAGVTISTGTLTANADLTTTTLTQSGGTLTGSGTVTVKTVTWSGGTMSGSGSTVVSSESTLTLTYGSSHYLDGRSLINNGSVVISGTLVSIVANNNGRIVNNGIFDFQGSTSVTHSTGTVGTFANNGTLKKTGNGTATIELTFNNSGDVQCDGGVLKFDPDGSVGTDNSTAVYTVAAGATLRFDLGSGAKSFTDRFPIGGAGTVDFKSGSFDFGAGDLTIASLSLLLDGATLTGSGAVTVHSFSCSGGTMSGSGRTIVAEGGTMTIDGIYLDGRSLVNDGTILLSNNSMAPIVVNNNGQIVNNGVFDLQGYQSITHATGTVGSFTNNGTFKKTGRTNTATIEITFNNHGTLQLDKGILKFAPEGDGGVDGDSAVYKVAIGATLQFILGTGTKTFAGASIESPGTVEFQSGTFFSSGMFTTQALIWSGGTMSGGGTIVIPDGGAMSVTATVYLNGRTLVNNGSVAIDGDNTIIYEQNNGKIVNNGTLSLLGIQSVLHAVGTVGSFTNNGTLQKTGTGTSTVGLTFNNNGNVQVAEGILSFSPSGDTPSTDNADAVYTVASGAKVQFALGGGTKTFSSDTFSGIGTVEFLRGTFDFGDVDVTIGETILSQKGGTINGNGHLTLTQLNLSNGTFIAGGRLVVTKLYQSGGVIQGGGSLTAQTFNWSGGTMSGTGSTIIPAGGTMTVSSNTILDGRPLTNNGSILLSGNNTKITAQNGGTILNNGVFDFQGVQTLAQGTGAIGSFTNNGTFRKSGVSGSRIDLPFNNNHVVQVEGGILSFSPAGASPGVDNPSAVYSAASGTTVQFVLESGTKSFNSDTFDGPGTVELSSGTLDSGDLDVTIAETILSQQGGTISGHGNLTLVELTLSNGVFSAGGNAMVSKLYQSGGTITGGGPLMVQTFSWSGGAMSGSGSTIIPAGGTTTVSSDPILDGRTFTNNGTVNFTGTDSVISEQNNGKFVNNGLFDFQGNQSISHASGAVGTFTNNGTLKKSGAGSAGVGLTFINNGTVQVAGGLLGFTPAGGAPGVDDGSAVYSAAAGTTVQFALGSGTKSFESDTFPGEGTVDFRSGTGDFGSHNVTLSKLSLSGGTLSGSGDFSAHSFTLSAGLLSGTGTFTAPTISWFGGTMGGGGTTIVPAGGTMTVSSSAILDGRTLTNNGTVLFSGTGTVLSEQNNGKFVNNGIFDFQGNQSINHASGTVGTFANNGTLKKSGAGISAVGVSFTNNGIVQGDSGTLQFNAALVNTAAGKMQGRAALELSNASFTNAGLTQPGNSNPGRLSIQGNYPLPTGTALNLRLGGTSAGTNYDQLAVSGNVTLGGVLNVSLAGSFVPAAETRFILLTAGGGSGIGGSFSAINLPPLPAEMEWRVASSETEIALTAIMTPYDFTVVKTGTGIGTVTSSPAGIDCGETCSTTFGSGTLVTLTAAAEAGSAFTGWSGDCTGTDGCALTVTAAKNVTANFEEVLTPPDAPTGVGATAGVAQATVNFTAPALNGGRPITGYTVTSDPGGITAGGDASPIVVTGLANGTSYTFTVTATNEIGTGPASAPSNMVTPFADTARPVINSFELPSDYHSLTVPVLDFAATDNVGVTGYCLTETLPVATGFLSASVVDAVSNEPIPNVLVTVMSSSVQVASGTTDDSGNILLTVNAGTGYKVLFSIEGYLPVTYNYVTVSEDQTTYLATVMQIEESHIGEGTIGGAIVNAFNGAAISGAALNLRAGINTSTGTVIATATTGADGRYLIDSLAAGNYTAEVTATGFSTGYFTIVSIGGETRINQNYSLTPILTTGQIRIVLTWGETPWDLDSHMTGPLADGSRFHVAYYAKVSPDGNVNLDRDDTSSYGPETTTIVTQLSGTYYFSVHDYSNKEASFSTAMAQSGAKVTVYKEDTIVAEFNVPNKEGTLWTVFELNGATITPLNTMSYESDPDDITGFSTVAFSEARQMQSSTVVPVCAWTEVPPENYTFSANGTQTLYAFTRDAAGNISLPASATTSITLAPDAPANVAATSGDSQALVSFTPPGSSGDGPITYYTVTSSPDNITATGASSPITITGLSNGTSYTFTVTATNSFGTGPFSAPSNVVTPGISLTVVKAGSGSGTIVSDPSGIDCGVGCSGWFNSGTQITLTAVPDSGSVFAGWSGVCSGTGSCELTLNEATTVTATFLPGTTVTPGDCDNNGQVSIAEVQGAINMYLGLKAIESCVDTDASGSTSIAEVQKVINGYLGL